MLQFFRRLLISLKVAWHVFRGRPVAVNVLVKGSLVAGDHALVANVIVEGGTFHTGIVTGRSSHLFHCTVIGSGDLKVGFGYTGHPDQEVKSYYTDDETKKPRQD